MGLAIGDWRLATMSNTDGPQPSGCINVRTTVRVRKQAASLNRRRVRRIDTLRPRALMQPEGCGPSVYLRSPGCMAMWLAGGQDFANGQLQILQIANIANRQSPIANRNGLAYF